MTRVTTTFSLTVQAPSGSSLAATIAQSLASDFPSSPAWSSELSTPAYLGASSIGVNVPARGTVGPSLFVPFNAPNSAGNTATLMYWSGKSKYTSLRGGEWWFSAGTTGKYPGSTTMVRYSLTDDAFQHWQGDSHTDAVSSCFGEYGCPHNFDGMAMNPTTGVIYRALPQPLDNSPYLNGLGIWDTGTKSGSVVSQNVGYVDLGVYPGVEYLPEANSVLVMYSGQVNRPIRRYDLSSGWAAETPNPYALTIGPSCYHDGKVYVCGGDDARTFYSVEWNGSGLTLTQRANTPVVMDLGRDPFNRTGFAVLCSIGNYLYAFCNRVVYRYDPSVSTAGSWTTHDQFPWADSNQDGYFTVGPLTDLGTALFVRSINDYTHQALMWKP